jgi:hypothetical protein
MRKVTQETRMLNDDTRKLAELISVHMIGGWAACARPLPADIRAEAQMALDYARTFEQVAKEGGSKVPLSRP